jgi:hypothetical protein
LWIAAAFQWPQVYGYLIGILAGSVASGTCAILPPWLARRKVERLGEA